MSGRYRLLCVDDEPWVLIGLKDILCWEEHGFEIAALCGSAEEALETLRATAIDAVITDIRMPGMTGLELIAAAKAENLAGMFVILSAHREFEFAKRAIEQGVFGYLVKPLERDDVVDVVRRLRERLDGQRVQAAEAARNAPLRLAEIEWTPQAQRLLKTAAGYGYCYVGLGGGQLAQAAGEAAGLAVTPVEIEGLPDCQLVSSQRPLAEAALACYAGASCAHHDFAAVAEMCAEALVSWRCGFHYADHGLIAQVQRYLGEHYGEKLMIRDVAKAFFLSEVYLSELFKRHAGRTIVQQIKDMRLHCGQALLADPALSIREVSERIGYEDPSYFGRLFKKEQGCSPEEYRKRLGIGG